MHSRARGARRERREMTSTGGKKLQSRGGVGRASGHELVSARTLAQEWDCSSRTVHRLLERAGVRPYYLHDARNGTKRFKREEVSAYLKSCTTE